MFSFKYILGAFDVKYWASEECEQFWVILVIAYNDIWWGLDSYGTFNIFFLILTPFDLK